MDILTVSFESPFTFTIQGQEVKVVTFKTLEHGNIKFGIDAPRTIKVNREEVHLGLAKQPVEKT